MSRRPELHLPDYDLAHWVLVGLGVLGVIGLMAFARDPAGAMAWLGEVIEKMGDTAEFAPSNPVVLPPGDPRLPLPTVTPHPALKQMEEQGLVPFLPGLTAGLRYSPDVVNILGETKGVIFDASTHPRDVRVARGSINSVMAAVNSTFRQIGVVVNNM